MLKYMKLILDSCKITSTDHIMSQSTTTTVTCPLDTSRAADIAALLHHPPPPSATHSYFTSLLSSRHLSSILSVTPSPHHGKGLYSLQEFHPNDLVFKDQMLFGIQHSSNKFDCLVCTFCYRFIGSVELQIGRRLYFQELGVHSSRCDDEESGERGVRVPEGVVDGLMNGGLKLPYSDQFQLPDVVSCVGGCKEAYYCSNECAEADWEAYHSLLCTGERSSALSTKALSKFVQHANETNDIFLLAAKVISFVILRYRKLKEARLGETNADHKKTCSSFSTPLLMKAWEPVAMGYKSRWWKCISLPDDLDDECSYRMQVKELAFESLQLLKKAIYDEECESLFSLEIYGHIIGMFEQNNLDLVVGSPLADYFLYIDDLPQSDKKKAEKITRPILDALGDDYSSCCEGTAFFPLQSCMNHSCRPNAKAFKREQDRDGQATIIALEHIQKGEEITISYIDEELPVEERQALLGDYGFTCRCPKCSEEA